MIAARLTRGVLSTTATPPAVAVRGGFAEGEPPLPYVSIVATGEGTPAATLAITRGFLGGRPAYWRRARDVVLASTDLDAVVAASRALGLSTSLDAEALAEACLLDGPARPPIREIASVAPGTRTEVSHGGVVTTSLGTPRAPAIDVRSAREELRRRLETAVARAVGGASRVGVLTGGGLDSSALLALAHRSTTANAFAIDFASPGDDRPHLAALARALDLAPVRIAPADAALPADPWVAGLPLTWPSGAAEAAALAAARTWGARRVLCGAFADQWLDGDVAAVCSALVAARQPWAALRLARRYDGASVLRASAFVARRGLALGLDRWGAGGPLRALSRRRRRPPRWAGPLLARVFDGPPPPDDDPFRSPLAARASELRLQEERLSGVLRVDPYLDEELVAYARALPPRALLPDGVRRGLFRDAVADLLPASLRLRPDKASFAPLHASLFRPPHAATLARLSPPEALADLGIVEPRPFADAVGRALASPAFAARYGAVLYPVLAVEAYARAWYDRGG